MSEDLNAISVDTTEDRREALSRQFDEAETAAPVLEPTEATDDRPRGPDGKFIAKDPSDAPAAPAEATAPPPAPAEEPLWKRPPQSWKKDYHEPWSNVPDPVKEYIYQRDQEQAAGVEPIKQKAQNFDQIDRVIEPFKPILQGLGIDAPTAIQALMTSDYRLRNGTPEQKLAVATELLGQYGIQIGDIDPAAVPRIDPTVQALQAELNRLKGTVTGWQSEREQEQEQIWVAQANKLASEVEYFEEARPTMIKLLNSGMAQNYEDAYKQAIRLDEALFQKSQQSLQAAQDKERRESANRAAQAAKAAAVSPRSATPGATTATNAQDRRSLLAEQFDGLSERL